MMEAEEILKGLLELGAQYNETARNWECVSCTARMGEEHKEFCLYQRGFNWRERLGEGSTTIWVVERGRYSNYHVLGVFSSKENAEKIAAMSWALDGADGPTNDGYSASVAEWPLDPSVKQISAGMKPYEIQMKRDGTTIFCELISTYGESDAFSPLDEKTETFNVHRNGKWAGKIMRVYTWAKDPEHAVKIANEKRTQLIAANEWPIDKLEKEKDDV